MKITFDTNNIDEVNEVKKFLGLENAHSVTVDRVEAPKKVKTTPSIPKKEKPVEAPVEPKTTKPKTITLDELKDTAKKAVLKTDRTKVKECISKYADKLAEVKTEDYEALLTALEGLK